MEKLFFTETGMIRLRWWPLLPPIAYIALNAVALGMIILGAGGRPDPFWHAPLYWVFG